MILPLENHGVKVMSMGLLTKGDQPVIWRGPMLHSVVAQFLLKVEWGELDYLVVDMPPGTGDVQLSLTQLVPVTGAVVVTTPQEVAAQDVRRAILMFDKVNVPIIGIVENMSFFVPEDEPQKKYYIFGKGGAGRVLSEKFKVPLLAELPIDPNVCEAGDTGTPIAAKENKLANVYLDLAKTVVQRINQIKTLGTYENIEIGSW
jgi:ATP-binding protein involved in chromosome partitioning